jgi:hypothetical protein
MFHFSPILVYLSLVKCFGGVIMKRVPSTMNALSNDKILTNSTSIVIEAALNYRSINTFNVVDVTVIKLYST